MSKHLHIYFSPWLHESRAFRAGKLAFQTGYASQIDYIGYSQSSLPPVEHKSSFERIILYPYYHHLPEVCGSYALFHFLSGISPVFERFHGIVHKLHIALLLYLYQHSLPMQTIYLFYMMPTSLKQNALVGLSQSDVLQNC